jgi:hypothetical protein
MAQIYLCLMAVSNKWQFPVLKQKGFKEIRLKTLKFARLKMHRQFMAKKSCFKNGFSETFLAPKFV